ncbi:MAG: hypothetical protein LBI72_06530 [Flavobacteriaceae bacterium]|jgi:hypothetical protein|nr:hypothetical protein [Flavobacteriaceae bacterium]
MNTLKILTVLLLLSSLPVFSFQGNDYNQCLFYDYQNDPTKPLVRSPIIYLINEKAEALQAKSTDENQLLWYTVKVGGVASTIAPIPSTKRLGIVNYWVSQQQADGKESRRVAIKVVVKELRRIR